jgi:hypothetical protein
MRLVTVLDLGLTSFMWLLAYWCWWGCWPFFGYDYRSAVEIELLILNDETTLGLFASNFRLLELKDFPFNNPNVTTGQLRHDDGGELFYGRIFICVPNLLGHLQGFFLVVAPVFQLLVVVIANFVSHLFFPLRFL